MSKNEFYSASTEHASDASPHPSFEAAKQSSELLRFVNSYVREMDTIVHSLFLFIKAAEEENRSLSERLKDFLTRFGQEIRNNEDKPTYFVSAKYTIPLESLSVGIERSSSVIQLFPKLHFTLLISTLEYLISSFATHLCLKFPNALSGSGHNIKYSDLTLCDSIDDAVSLIIESEVESITSKAHIEQFKWFKDKHHIKYDFGAIVLSDYIEASLRRNIIVHNNSIVNSHYIRQCKNLNVPLDVSISVGDKITITPDYFNKSFNALYEVGIIFAYSTWRKVYAKDDAEITESDKSITSIIYDLIRKGNYTLAIRLSIFSLSKVFNCSSDVDRKMRIINLAQCYKWTEHQIECNNIIEEEDWSACDNQFKMALAVLKDDYKVAEEIMRRLGSEDESIGEANYLKWPLFRKWRETESFATTFKEVFGHEPETPVKYPVQNISEEENDKPSSESLPQGNRLDVNTRKARPVFGRKRGRKKR